MRNVKAGLNPHSFNRSIKSEWVVVHEGTDIIYHGTNGITATQKTMFVGTKPECEVYIAENGLIAEELIEE